MIEGNRAGPRAPFDSVHPFVESDHITFAAMVEAVRNMANIPSPGQTRVPPGAERREEAPASHVWDSLMMAQRSLLSDALAAQLRVEPHRVPCQVLEVCEAHVFRIPVFDMVRLKFILAEQDDTLVPLMLR